MWLRCGYPEGSARWVWGVRMQQQVQLEGVERQLGGQGAVGIFVFFVCVMGGEGMDVRWVGDDLFTWIRLALSGTTEVRASPVCSAMCIWIKGTLSVSSSLSFAI